MRNIRNEDGIDNAEKPISYSTLPVIIQFRIRFAIPTACQLDMRLNILVNQITITLLRKRTTCSSDKRNIVHVTIIISRNNLRYQNYVKRNGRGSIP